MLMFAEFSGGASSAPCKYAPGTSLLLPVQHRTVIPLSRCSWQPMWMVDDVWILPAQ